MLTAKSDIEVKSLFIKRISEKDFAFLREQWNELLSRSVTNEFFLSWEWMFSWWNTFKNEKKELLIVCGYNTQEQLLGIAPFYIEKKRYFGVRRNTVKFCSSSETAPDHLDILCDRRVEHLFPKLVFDYLQTHEMEWDEITLEGVHENSCIKNYLLKHQNGLLKLLIECNADSRCPYLSIDKTFEDFLGSFSGKTRNTLLRKKKNLLEKENWKCCILDSQSDNLQHYLKTLFLLHAERAKRKNYPTAFRGDKVYRFHESLMGYLLNENKIIIAFLLKESVCQAFYYCIKYKNKYYYYQTGLSAHGEEKSAGTVLLSLMIEKAFSERCSEFDFLRGDEKYKYFWANNTRFNFSLFIKKNNISNRAAHYLSHRVIKPSKKLIKNVYSKNRN